MPNFLKRITKKLLDDVVVPLDQYVANRKPGPNLIRELERRTAEECADYVQAKMPAALHFDRKKDLWDHALTKVSTAGIAVEFGVWNGVSINHIARKIAPSPIYGFDSFEGLKEDWAGWTETKGSFSRQGKLPTVDPNVRLVKGWFDQTLPTFLEGAQNTFSFVHVDCDTYEASNTVLTLVAKRIVTGSVVVFDEYLGYRGWKLGEFRAWQEFVAREKMDYEYLSFSTQTVAVRVRRK
jgi:predicted O-methyltransferase YrrM